MTTKMHVPCHRMFIKQRMLSNYRDMVNVNCDMVYIDFEQNYKQVIKMWFLLS